MGKGLSPRIRVTAPTGTSVTGALGSNSVNFTEVSSGVFEADVKKLGPWTVTGTSGQKTASITVDVDDVARVEGDFGPALKTLDDCTWAEISAVSAAGTGANYFSVGDCKAVELNGTVGICTFTNETYCAYIIGFNHNSTLEGDNRIHFQFGKTAVSGGTDICFVDSAYRNAGSTAAFRMNAANTNSGGWNSSYMRNTICGTSISSYSGTFIAALPSDLRSVLKAVTKYTDNTGGGSDTASYVTATTDVIFLLSEWEVYGARTYVNSAEKNYQAQYDYYKNGNSKVKYKHNATTTAAFWWLRSPLSFNARGFVLVSMNGSVTTGDAYVSNGFAPAFVV